MDPMASIRETFFQECAEQLTELESGLLEIDRGGGDAETINAVFRAVHSIKGGASAFGFEELVEFVHVFETTLDLIRSNKIQATQSVVACLLRSSDVLADLVKGAREGTATDADAVAAAKKELDALCNGVEGGSEDGDDAVTPDEFDDLAFEPVADRKSVG
jgi:two-component system chemotaxis sensor kinase CheA